MLASSDMCYKPKINRLVNLISRVPRNISMGRRGYSGSGLTPCSVTVCRPCRGSVLFFLFAGAAPAARSCPCLPSIAPERGSECRSLTLANDDLSG